MLLLGSEAAQATAHATTAEKTEVFAFTAAATGVIEELQLETNGTANTGVTGVWLGIYAEEDQAAKKAAGLIQAVKVNGTPAINSAITATGFSVPVIAGKRYWLAVLSIGAPLHFNVNAAAGENAKGTFAAPTMRFINGGGLTAVSGTGGTPKFAGKGPAIGSARALTYGVQNATNHVSLWAPKAIRYSRGSSVAETNLNEAGEKTPGAISALVGAAVTDGFTSPGVVLNVETLLSSVNAAIYAEKFAAVVKRVKEDHPSVTVRYDLINEPWEKGPHRKSNAADYAAIVKATIEKLRAEGLYTSPHVIVLVAAYGTYETVNGEGVGTGTFSNVWQGNGWIHDMFAAQPSLKAAGENEITAWVSHNYGRAAEITSLVQGGFPAAVSLRQLVIEEEGGGYNNWHINEFGFALGGEAKGRNVSSEAEQKTCLEEYVQASQCAGEAGWLTLINVYADGTSEWGINGKPAGTFYGEWAEAHAVSTAPPTITNPGAQVSTVGVPVNLPLTATNTTSYAATGLPTGLAINPGTGAITGTPTTTQTTTVRVTVTGPGGTASTEWVWVTELTLLPEAAHLYQQLKPVAEDDDSHGDATQHLCAVLMAPVEMISQFAADNADRPGWALDVNTIPAPLLPWLGQFNGTPLEAGEPEEEQRRKIREARGSHRGTIRAIKSDVQAVLTGTKFVDILERTGQPFSNVIVTKPAETPSTAAVLTALYDRNTKPLGVIYDLVVTDTWIIGEIEEFEPSVAAAEAVGTVKAVEEHGVI